MTQFKFLFPQTQASLAEWLEIAVAAPLPEPFSPRRMEVVARWSDSLFRIAGADPACASLAFWLRRASIMALAEGFHEQGGGTQHRFARGLVFTVAPANVPTMAAYSFALAYLCGNTCVVRISPRGIDQSRHFVSALAEAFGQAAVDDAAFISYGRDDQVTSSISMRADIRVLWGGDQAVSELRALPSKITVRDICFVDRFSYAVIVASEVITSSHEQLDVLAAGMFNDAYWFDQLACASPSVIVWVGDKVAAETASYLLMSALRAVIDRKQYTIATSVAMDKLTFAFTSAATGRSSRLRTAGNEAFLSQLSGTRFVRDPRCGGGYFEEIRIATLDEMTSLVDRRDQTMTYFGFSTEELLRFSRSAGAKGIDRIVPIGKALQFGRFWDGHDLLQEFTRIQAIETPSKSIR